MFLPRLTSHESYPILLLRFHFISDAEVLQRRFWNCIWVLLSPSSSFFSLKISWFYQYVFSPTESSHPLEWADKSSAGAQCTVVTRFRRPNSIFHWYPQIEHFSFYFPSLTKLLPLFGRRDENHLCFHDPQLFYLKPSDREHFLWHCYLFHWE